MPTWIVTTPQGTKVPVEAATEEESKLKVKTQLESQKTFLEGLFGGAAKGFPSFAETSPFGGAQIGVARRIAGLPPDPASAYLEKKFPTPSNLEGRIGQGFGEALTNPITYGSGGVGGFLRSLAGGAGSEIAGLMSGDNPLARLIGGVVPGVAPRAAVKATTPKSIPPENVPLGEELTRQGVGFKAGDITGSRALQAAERLGDRIGGGGSYTEANRKINMQYTNAAGRTMGTPEGTSFITPAELRQAHDEVGDEFTRVAKKMDLRDIGGKLRDDFQVIGDKVSQVEQAPPEVQRDIFRLMRMVTDAMVDNGGRMTGDAYQTLTRYDAPLGRASRDVNPTTAFYAGKIREALDEMMMRSANRQGTRPGTGQRQLVEDLLAARKKWFNMTMISEALAKGGPRAQAGVVTPENLFSVVAANQKNAYGFITNDSDLVKLARAGQILSQRSSTLGEIGGAHGVGAAAGFALGHGSLGASVIPGIIGPGLIGRAANSEYFQEYVKMQKSLELLKRMETIQTSAARGVAISDPNKKRRETYGGTIE